jgi:hypothetical protein
MTDLTVSGGLRSKEKNMVYGLGQARASGARRFPSIESMHKEEGRITTPEESQKVYEENQKRFFKQAESLDHYYKYPRSDIGMFDRLDNLSKSVGDYLRGPRTISGMMRALYKNDYIGVPEHKAEDLMTLAEDIRISPTSYFEGKPERAIGMNEFAGAVIPKNASKSVRDILEKHGIKAVEYDPKVEGDRTEKTKNFQPEDVRFQRQTADPFFSPTLRAVQSLKQDRGTGEQMFNMITKAPGVKEAEWKWMGLDDFLKGKQSVTKQEIQDFVAQKVKGEGQKDDFEENIRNEIDEMISEISENPSSEEMATRLYNKINSLLSKETQDKLERLRESFEEGEEWKAQDVVDEIQELQKNIMDKKYRESVSNLAKLKAPPEIFRLAGWLKKNHNADLTDYKVFERDRVVPEGYEHIPVNDFPAGLSGWHTRRLLGNINKSDPKPVKVKTREAYIEVLSREPGFNPILVANELKKMGYPNADANSPTSINLGEVGTLPFGEKSGTLFHSPDKLRLTDEENKQYEDLSKRMEDLNQLEFKKWEELDNKIKAFSKEEHKPNEGQPLFQKGTTNEPGAARNLPEKQFRAAKASDQNAAKALAGPAGKKLGRSLTADDIRAVEPVDPEARSAAQAIRKITGKPVVFVQTSDAMKSAGIDFNGAHFGGRIFLNAEGEHPYLITGFHETWEGILKDHPDLVNPLVDHVMENMTPEGRVAANRRALSEIPEGTPTEPDIRNAVKENLFDHAASQMSRPEWWTSLYEKSPQAVKQIVQGIISYLNKFLSEMKIRKLDGSQYFKDAQDINSRLKAVHREVLKRQFGDEQAQQLAGDMAEFSRGETKTASGETKLPKSETVTTKLETPEPKGETKKRNTYSIKRKKKGKEA